MATKPTAPAQLSRGDRNRDRRLQAGGWTVVRIIWRQLDDEMTLAADLHKLLNGGTPLG
jgi:very-short-patch-repair endonuclease